LKAISDSKVPYQKSDQGWIFYSNPYQLNNGIRDVYCFEHKSEKGIIAASIFFSVDKSTATSLPNCPGAGFQMLNPISKNNFIQFLNKTRDHFDDGTKITIKQSPGFYSLANPIWLHESLIEFGFQASAEVNHHVDLRDPSLKEKIHKMEHRKIKKCETDGFSFEQVLKPDIDQVYSFLAKCRSHQGLSVNISKNQLNSILSKMPKDYFVYAVKTANNELAALTVLLRVNQSVIYNFLPAFDRNFKSHSPMAFLHFRLFQELMGLGYRYWDLGISSVGGQPQRGLIKFKERMGGIRSDRFTYHL